MIIIIVIIIIIIIIIIQFPNSIVLQYPLGQYSFKTKTRAMFSISSISE